MEIRKVPISSVVPWDKNPRGITEADFARLKKQVEKLGPYKPLLVFRAGKKYVVLGGNMRLRAYKELGIKEVEISIVEAKTQSRRIEFALSDNDRAGFYEEGKLAELLQPHISLLDLEDFKIDIGYAANLKQIMERFGPDLEPKEQEFDESLATTNECPRCGYKW